MLTFAYFAMDIKNNKYNTTATLPLLNPSSSISDTLLVMNPTRITNPDITNKNMNKNIIFTP